MTTNTTPTGRQKSGATGGNVTKKKYGTEFFREIGRRGGKAKKGSSKRSPNRP